MDITKFNSLQAFFRTNEAKEEHDFPFKRHISHANCVALSLQRCTALLQTYFDVSTLNWGKGHKATRRYMHANGRALTKAPR